MATRRHPTCLVLVCMDLFCDAVEAHSCVDPLMPNSFLSKTQLLMINQLQNVSTRRSLSTAYRKLKKEFGINLFCIYLIFYLSKWLLLLSIVQ